MFEQVYMSFKFNVSRVTGIRDPLIFNFDSNRCVNTCVLVYMYIPVDIRVYEIIIVSLNFSSSFFVANSSARVV